MIKQKEIAKKLNLSVMTVSKALRNHPDLAEATKERVIQKALEMGYTDIPAIQKQKQRPLGILAYASPTEITPLFESEIRRRIFEAIQHECGRNHIETVVEFANPTEVPLSIRNGSVNGVFVLGRYTAETVANLRGTPALAVSSFISTNLLPRITADNQGGIRLVTRHLIELGHRDILFLGIEEEGSELHRERADGYYLEMRHHDLKPSLQFLPRGGVEEVAEKVLKSGAVVCSSDALAHMLIKALRARGKSVPKDCSIVGFDNLVHGDIDFLTTYAPDCSLMGQLAVQLLLSSGKQINEQNVHVTVPGQLIVRKSTAPRR